MLPDGRKETSVRCIICVKWQIFRRVERFVKRKKRWCYVKGYPFASCLPERLRVISNFSEIIKLVGNTWKIRTDMINWSRFAFTAVSTDTASVLFGWKLAFPRTSKTSRWYLGWCGTRWGDAWLAQVVQLPCSPEFISLVEIIDQFC